MQQITAAQIGEFIKLTAGNVSRAQFQARLARPKILNEFLKTGKVPELAVFLHELKERTEKVLSAKFSKKIEIGDFPSEFTEENLKKWEKMNFRPIFLPDEEITQARKLKDWVKPREWFYQKIKQGKIAKDAATLKKGWYLADFTPAVDYTDGTQVFPNDPLVPIITKLREQKKVGKYEKTPAGSRFAIVPQNEWPLVCEVVLKELGIDSKRATCRLERVVEFNTIGNLYDSNRGKFNIWEWFADDFEDSSRLYGGSRDYDGLAYVCSYWSHYRYDHTAARPLVSFA